MSKCNLCQDKGYVNVWVADKATGAHTRGIKIPCKDCKKSCCAPEDK